MSRAEVSLSQVLTGANTEELNYILAQINIGLFLEAVHDSTVQWLLDARIQELTVLSR